jgi:hypothetical protein
MYRVKWAIVFAVLAAGPAAAQAPKGAQTVYTNRPAFSLPVRIDDHDRGEVSQLKFYVKAMQGSRANEWVCLETAAASKTKFGYKAPQDGEYWFSFAFVDKSGQVTPSNLDKAPPGLVVVVDTRAPEVEVQKIPSPTGEMLLQCKVHDNNPDYSAIKLEYKGIDRAWHALDPAETPGTFHIPDRSILKGVVRASAADKAGNQSVRELDMTRDVPKIQTTAAKQTVAAPTMPPSSEEPQPAKLPIRIVERPTPPPSTVEPPAKLPMRMVEKSTPPTATEAPTNDKPQLLNGIHCVLEYAVDMPSATKVAAYATKDGGQTWLPIGEEGDRKGPMDCELPGDGTYGLVLVAGTEANPPQAPASGDSADWWVEIDSHKPSIQMIDMHLGTGDEAGQIVIKWSTEAKHLGSNPVSLYWSATPNGPWELGAKNMKATGSARWAVPEDAGSKFYLRLEATDKAGNIGRWESNEPVSMTTEKASGHARILAVSVKK